jgi:hypothetical protein
MSTPSYKVLFECAPSMLGEKFMESGNCDKQPHETVLITDLKSRDQSHFRVEITIASGLRSL